MKFANRAFPILVLGLLSGILLLHAGCASTGYNGGGRRGRTNDGPSHTDGSDGCCGKRAGDAELDCQLGRDGLLREALHHQRRPVHADCDAKPRQTTPTRA